MNVEAWPDDITDRNIGPMYSQISANVSGVPIPSAAGCLVDPRMGRYASL